MLLQASPVDIGERWPLFRKAILESFPPTAFKGAGALDKVQIDLLSGEKQGWIGTYGDQMVLVGVTSTVYDADSTNKHLLVYAMYSLSEEKLPSHFLDECFDIIGRYAASTGHVKVVAYTTLPHILRMARERGADVWSYVEWKV